MFQKLFLNRKFSNRYPIKLKREIQMSIIINVQLLILILTAHHFRHVLGIEKCVSYACSTYVTHLEVGEVKKDFFQDAFDLDPFTSNFQLKKKTKTTCQLLQRKLPYTDNNHQGFSFFASLKSKYDCFTFV